MNERREQTRDQAESAFTPLLRWLWSRSPDILGVVFVDQEGECVDYCASMAPFEAKVAGAHMRVVATHVSEALATLGGGELHSVEIYGAERELIVRRLDECYLVAVVVSAGGVNHGLMDATERAVAALRDEAGVPPPPWEPHAGPIEVELRAAIGWPYAPAAFRQGGGRTPIVAVLGRWFEPGGAVGGELVCFRVRSSDGTELTLAHDISQDRWLRW